MSAKRGRPGLAKTRGQRLLHSRHVELWQSSDYQLRRLFESADVMSEGRTKNELEESVYYGSTSILISKTSLLELGTQDLAAVARLLGADPHARLRAVRIACLEAQLRAGGKLGPVRAELMIRKDKRGVRVDVEVEARVQRDASSVRSTKRRAPRQSRTRTTGR